MLVSVDENAPNGMAWGAPVKHDPFPEEDAPLVRHYADDTPREKRMADALEAATKRALEDEQNRCMARAG